MVIQNKKRYDGTVLNLDTGESIQYSESLEPRDAVIAAYAQSIGDFNTWMYDKYSGRVQESNLCYLLGDFAAFKE